MGREFFVWGALRAGLSCFCSHFCGAGRGAWRAAGAKKRGLKKSAFKKIFFFF